MFTSLEITSDGVIKDSPGSLHGLLLTAGAANATIVLYDNPSAASGNIVATLKAVQNDSNYYPAPGVVFANGLYADITGADAAAYVHYM